MWQPLKNFRNRQIKNLAKVFRCTMCNFSLHTLLFLILHTNNSFCVHTFIYEVYIQLYSVVQLCQSIPTC